MPSKKNNFLIKTILVGIPLCFIYAYMEVNYDIPKYVKKTLLAALGVYVIVKSTKAWNEDGE